MQKRIFHVIVPMVFIAAMLALVIRPVRASELEYDLNLDGKVDLKDVFEVGKAFGSIPGDPKWNPLTDLNGDGKVDLKDYFIIAKYFGYPGEILVVPEYWMGTIIGLAGCFGAFGLFRAVKCRKP